MIPLVYRLRDRVRLTDGGGSWRVISELPLNVLSINEAAAHMLMQTQRGAAVHDLATTLSLDEERVLRLCEYFRGKGLMDVALDPAVQFTPSVSVIVPTKDRAAELEECLAALSALDYPRELVEVIVVDDGSADDTAATAGRADCRLIVNDHTRGQSYSRNRGGSLASGAILAFIDSDCVADPGWLRELVPYFAWERVAAVGGLVRSYYTSSTLDRYEETASSLWMGRSLALSLESKTSFYVPTCNLLVRREAYFAAGGVREDLHVGEDVDLCWRLRGRGGYIVYTPHGSVRHKHRNRLGAMLRRRAQYGTSEATLHMLHGEKRKSLPLSALPSLTFIAVMILLVSRDARLIPIVFLPCIWDATRRAWHLRQECIAMPWWRTGFSVLRGHLSLVYYLLFHLVRYYLLLLLIAGIVVPSLWIVAAFAVLYASIVDYSIQSPRLNYPLFLVYYVLEHAAYQVGVGLGCLRRRTLRPFLVSFRKTKALAGS